MSGFQDIVCYGQKIVNVEAEKTLCVELLSRIKNLPAGQNIESFFNSLTPEQSLEISLWQIDLAARLYEQNHFICGINIDNSTLVEDSLKYKLIDHCRNVVIPVKLEFTELTPMPPADEINSFFNVLRSHGVTVCLDDFGTGFNGFSVFADYDFDLVKIDRKLILGFETRPQKLSLLEHICNMLETLGKEHIVEGVESQSQFDALREIGFRNFQGFLFHVPEPVENIIGEC